jgi:nicotinamide riboside kinase
MKTRTIIISGPQGSGKSTLANKLVRLFKVSKEREDLFTDQQEFLNMDPESFKESDFIVIDQCQIEVLDKVLDKIQGFYGHVIILTQDKMPHDVFSRYSYEYSELR